MNRQHSTTKQPPRESHWHGSLKTAVLIRRQIAERYGEEEAERYDPTANCFTFNEWRRRGYHVKKGEKALHSYTLVGSSKEDGDGEEEEGGRYLKGVCLFYIKQVEKNEEQQNGAA